MYSQHLLFIFLALEVNVFCVDQIVSPDDEEIPDSFEFKVEKSNKNDETPNEIPMEIYRKLDKVRSLKEFYEIFSISDSDTFGGVFRDQFSSTVERSNAILAEQAICEPELQTIKLINVTDENHSYYPSCVRVHRCGGCCASPKMICTPSVSKTEVYRVNVLNIEKKTYERYEDIPVEKHINCTCQCKVQEHECTASQKYNPHLCVCECLESDDFDKCNNENKHWDSKNCTCKCKPNSEECNTGEHYDVESCKCVSNRKKGGKRKYKVNPSKPKINNS